MLFGLLGRGVAGIGFCVLLAGCAVGSLTSAPPAAEASLSSSHLTLRQQAALLAQTSWDEMSGRGASLASFASILMEGRPKEEAPTTTASNGPQDQAAFYLAAMSQKHANTDAIVNAVARDVRLKTADVGRFLDCAADMDQETMARVLVVEGRQFVSLASAKLKRQRVTFMVVERTLADDPYAADTSALNAALENLRLEIEALDALAVEFSKTLTVTAS